MTLHKWSVQKAMNTAEHDVMNVSFVVKGNDDHFIHCCIRDIMSSISVSECQSLRKFHIRLGHLDSSPEFVVD